MTQKPRYLAALIMGACLLGCSSDPVPTPPPVVGPLGDRADLPVDTRIQIDGLSAPVDVVRDDRGRPHIYASNLTDALRAEGYIVALDRTLQLDLSRRNAQGKLAEYFAKIDAEVITQDIIFRTIGVNRVAAAQYAAIDDPEAKALLDAYADGITQAYRRIRSGEIPMPASISTYPVEALVDWTPVDSLAVVRLQSLLLSYDADTEAVHTNLFAALGETFPANSPDPVLAKRAATARDLFRVAPPGAGSSSLKAPGSSPKVGSPQAAPARLPASTDGYFRGLAKIRERLAPDGYGSNTWAVTPSRSATGHVLLASDPHLPLESPAVFWPVALHVGAAPEGLHVSGVAFPGVPGIVLGHNEHIAWGSAVAGYDVTDLYNEQLTPDGKAVIWKGEPVPLETIDEVIAIEGADPIMYKVQIVPHHGPITPTIVNGTIIPINPAAGAVSIRWTGHEPTRDIEAILTLLRAKSVDEARTALDRFDVGAQSWVIGDTAGDILVTTHARVPKRAAGAFTWDPATHTGTVPCLVLPGDGTAEWEGYIPGDLIPWKKNPDEGYLVAANNDLMGGTSDGDPTNDTFADGTRAYLGCKFDPGYRAGRISTLLEGTAGGLEPEDMARIQEDARSTLGARLVPFLLDAITRGEAERTTPGTHPDLTALVAEPAYEPARIAAIKVALEQWGAEADYLAASGFDPDTGELLSDADGAPTAVEARAARSTLIFNIWFLRLLRRTFGDEYVRAGHPLIFRTLQVEGILHLLEDDPASIGTFDPSTNESALWDDIDTPAIESRHERALRSLLDAFTWLDKKGQGANAAWGAHHVVRFSPIAPTWVEMYMPLVTDPVFKNGFHRRGDLHGVDSAEFRVSWAIDEIPTFNFYTGAAQRFVIDLDPAGPKSWNALPGGNIWDPASPHFRDGADLWRQNKTLSVPFHVEDVVAVKESRLLLTSP